MLLLGLMCSCLTVLKWAAHSDILLQQEHTDYAQLRRTRFDDIVQRDKQLASAAAANDYSHRDIGVRGIRSFKVNHDDSLYQKELLRAEKDAKVREILINSRNLRTFDKNDLSKPKPVQKGSEQAEESHILRNEEFDIMSRSNSSSSALLSSDGHIRNCITENVIGKVSESVTAQELQPFEAESVEVSEKRKASFQTVFDTKAWGHSWDAAENRGIIDASGKSKH